MDITNKEIKLIKKMLVHGEVRHSVIMPQLNNANLQDIDPDDIVEFIYSYKAGEKNVLSGFFKAILRIFRIVLCVTITLSGGIFLAALTARNIFEDSLIANKLSGFFDYLLFWAGFKSINISGPDMLRSYADMIAATPRVILKFVQGCFIGFIIWLVVFLLYRLIKFAAKRIKLNSKIKQLLGGAE